MSRSRRLKHTPMELIHPLAAGIDIGATEVWVGIPPDLCTESTRRFETFTDSFEELAAWLVQLGVTTVAMEATGVYWVALFDLIGAHGIDVVLVDARQTKHVSGRKSDLLDCQWIQTLHAHGLLSPVYTPTADTASLRTYERLRQELVAESTRHIQRMQKALTTMNIQLHHVISDITGKSGMAIIRAIVAGERSGPVLAALCDGRIKASQEEVTRSLIGEYRSDHVFALTSAVRQYDSVQKELTVIQQEIRRQIIRNYGGDPDQTPPPPDRKSHQVDELRRHLTHMCGDNDPTSIEGIGLTTAITILSETGCDRSHWPTVKHFTSWCKLSPNNRISGGKVLSSRSTRKRKRNRAGQAFRQAAESLIRSKTALGAFIRRQRARKGSAYALTCGARKLAALFYQLIRHGIQPKELSEDHYEEKYKQRQTKSLERLAKSLGMKVVMA